MAIKYSANYDLDILAEVYDQQETDTLDVELLRSLLPEGQLKIVEVFSGTGRILLPLLEDGHDVTGIELAQAMHQRCRDKAAQLGPTKGALILRCEDALSSPWGNQDYDVVIIGNNALYELPSADLQELCITKAWQALKPGGYLFTDHGNWQERLSKEAVGDSWTSITGTTAAGFQFKESAEIIAIDEEKQVMEIKRTWQITAPDGKGSQSIHVGGKHPFGFQEVKTWLDRAGFKQVQEFGEKTGSPFSPKSPRYISWAQK